MNMVWSGISFVITYFSYPHTHLFLVSYPEGEGWRFKPPLYIFGIFFLNGVYRADQKSKPLSLIIIKSY